MKHQSLTTLVTVAACFAATPIGAENVIDSHFGADDSLATGCYILKIAPEDLAARPGAQVEYLSLSYSPLSAADDKMLGLQVKLRDDPYFYYVASHCRKKGADQKCIAENGSGFRVSAADAATVRLTILPRGLELAGNRIVTISGKEGEDREFLIPAVPSDHCQ